jgi:hypothetical protein
MTTETLAINDSVVNETSTTENQMLPTANLDKTKKDLHGSCCCGSVNLVVPKGSTILMSGYCHCVSCQLMTSCPVTSCFGISTVEVPDFPTEEETDTLSFMQVTENGPKRFFCKKCSVYMYSHWHDSTMSINFLNHIPFKAFDEIPPNYHCNYMSKIITMKDGLPKYKEFPPHEPGKTAELLED